MSSAVEGRNDEEPQGDPRAPSGCHWMADKHKYPEKDTVWSKKFLGRR